MKDTLRHFEKRINKLRNRVSDLVADLHRRVAFDIVSNFDVVLLPKFETKAMAHKLRRKINSKAVRAMLGFGHYRFKQTLKWMCRKYGKHFIEVNEAWTSVTQSWNGRVKHNLGSAKMIGKTLKVDRDINGARNILLRALSVASTDVRYVSCV